MFERIKQRAFVAKMMAEIKAQHDDQAFVNQLAGVFVSLALSCSSAFGADQNPTSPKTPTKECIDLRSDDDKPLKFSLRGFVAEKANVHPTKGRFFGSVLVLDTAQCFDDSGKDMEGRYRERHFRDVTHVQLTGEIQGLPEKGTPALLTGAGFTAHSAWHITPIIMVLPR